MALPNLRVLVVNSDLSGCWQYRCEIPFKELRRYNMDYDCYPFLPVRPHQTHNLLDTFLNFVRPYDMVMIQRCYLFDIAFELKKACDILGIPLIFDTDDDYINIPDHNPCGDELRSNEQIRKFCTVLSLMDYVTVTTEELKRLYYPYNKNIAVFPNNVETVHEFKDIGQLERDEDGNYKPYIKNGFYSLPAYLMEGKAGKRLIRIGYSTNTTHRRDFSKVMKGLFNVLNKYPEKLMMIYFGDPPDTKLAEDHPMYGRGEFYVATKTACPDANVLSIPSSYYGLYYLNLRNIDIGIAPLETDIFNMSKSPIKAVEYGSWGIPAVLPNYITYNREFVDGKTCLMYDNEHQFESQLRRLIDSVELRESIGNGARDYVKANRREKIHAPRRYNLFTSLMNSKRKVKVFA